MKARLYELSWRGSEFQCPLCEACLARFEPLPWYYFVEWQNYAYVHSIFAEETLNIAQFSCPSCGAMDRERLIAIYCRQLCQHREKRRRDRVLELGPTVALSGFLNKLPILHRSADISHSGAHDVVDITDMHAYNDASFDMFVCCHVLEHVVDDRRAVGELFRILAPGGRGIVMVPINLALEETHEDAAAITEAERWRQFGQHDHVRLYSKPGFLALLKDSGFSVQELGIRDFGESVFRRHGIHPRSVLYVVEKRNGEITRV